MHRQRQAMLAINVVGGLAVLGSYAHGITTRADASALWGGIPVALRGPYSAVMPVAAVGYLLFWSLLNFRVDPQAARPPLRRFCALFVAILLPSALWMPLTFAYLSQPSPLRWLLVRAGLGVTGVAAITLIAALVSLRPRAPSLHYWLALCGSVAFALQTAVLDALIWPAFFHR